MQFAQDAKKIAFCIGLCAGSAVVGISAWKFFRKYQKSIGTTALEMELDAKPRKKQKLSGDKDDQDEEVLVPILLPGGAVAFRPRSQAGGREIVFSKSTMQVSGNDDDGDDNHISQNSSKQQTISDKRINTVKHVKERRQSNSNSDGDVGECSKLLGKAEEESALGGPKFSPPLYKQRYSLVCDVVDEARESGGLTLSSLADFGCAELKFLQRAKNFLKYMEKLIGVDIDRDLLELNQHTLNPLLFEYLMRRSTPLEVGLYCGSVADCDPRLRDVHVCTLIEIIEHLHDDVLEKLPQNVFGYIKPKLVIITTPNSEYNVLFPDMPAGEFRHWDHKFEWTRKQFQDWCDAIVDRYPAYAVRYSGVGPPPEDCPPEAAHVGFCSQAAIFTIKQESSDPPRKGGAYEERYSMVREVEYPWQAATPWEGKMDAEVYYCMGLVLNGYRPQRSGTPSRDDLRDEDPEVEDDVTRVSLEELFEQPRLIRLCDGDIGKLREYLRMEMPDRLSEDGTTVLWPIDRPPSDSDSDGYGEDCDDRDLDPDQQPDFSSTPPACAWDANPQTPSPPLADAPLSQRDETVRDETVRDETVRDETVRDETVRDKTVRDETVRDETVRDETVRDETIRDDTVRDETGRDETVRDETIRDDTVRDETGRDETVRDETVRDETVRDETVRDETVRDETVRDETVRDETVLDDTGRDETVRDETVRGETVRDETVRDETVRDETVRDETVRDETVRDETVRDETMRDQTVRGEAVPDETVQDETVRDETIRDQTVRGETVPDETVRDETVRDETVRDDTVRDETARDETVSDDTVRDETVREAMTENDVNNHPSSSNDRKKDPHVGEDGGGNDIDDQDDEYIDDDISTFTNDSYIGDESF